MKSLKDFQKIKTKRIIPLGIKGSDIGITDRRETPKLTVNVGIKIQEIIKKFQHEYFDLELLKDEIHLVLSARGERAIKIRTQKDPEYLNKIIKGFQETVSDYNKN